MRAIIQEHLDKVNEKFARVEQVKKFEILPHDLSQETGELTPTLKVKRNVVADKFEQDVDALYAVAVLPARSVAPDSFKGTLSARQVAEAIGEGRRAGAGRDADLCPAADGGEGTTAVLRRARSVASCAPPRPTTRSAGRSRPSTRSCATAPRRSSRSPPRRA